MSDLRTATQHSRIALLARTIAAQTQVIDTHIQANGLPEPSFEPDAPKEPIRNATPEVDKAKIAVLEAAIELRQLLEGPVKALLPESNFAPLAAIYRFNIASFVPKTGTISFDDLANKCGLLEHDVKRILRYVAVHHRVFHEPNPGFIAHTAASRLLSESDQVSDIMGLTFAECWPAHSRAVDAMAEKSEEPNVTGYALANGTTLNTFEYLNANTERAKRFSGAMSSTSKASLDALAQYFEWEGLQEGSTVVDIGGSRGHVSVHLAQLFKHLKFIVQDMAEVVKDADAGVPEEVADRVSFMDHDMFTEQPVIHADVYLLRFVLHDWPDKYCIKILKQLIPALKRGAKVVIQDHLLSDPGSLPLLQEMQIRSMDAIMLSLFNSREREVQDWKAIVESADERFVDFKAERIQKNPLTGVVVVTWNDGDL
ncbi:putative O-methyltransferase [Pyrenochaeta sp. MPI-SDFR-AT-0127]|nr:putative O-methyltransferase [Pyrenochaeta sp. MPI-SDFR-AT-0127]